MGTPPKTWTALAVLRRSKRCTLWSALPTAIWCALPGLYLTQHTFARRSIATVGVACFVDHTCAHSSWHPQQRDGPTASIALSRNRHTQCTHSVSKNMDSMHIAKKRKCTGYYIAA